MIPYALAGLSGLLLVALFPPWNATWLAWVALWPALFAVHLDKAALPAWRDRRWWGIGLVLGLLYFGGTLWWIGLVTAAGTAALVAYIALYPAAWLLWARRRWFGDSLSSVGNLAAGAELASIWTLGEWLRGWLFTGFGWNGLGVALHTNLPLTQGARWGGVLLLTWLVVFVNVVGMRSAVRFAREAKGLQRVRPHWDFGVAMLAVALLFAAGMHHLFHATGDVRTLRFAAIQPDIPQDEVHPFSSEEALKIELDLTEQAALLKPDLILWPEAPVAADVRLDPPYRTALDKLTVAMPYHLLIGSLAFDAESRLFNTAMLFSPGGGAPQVYRKGHLVPFGEYAPFADSVPLMRKLVPFDLDFSPGKAPEVVAMEKGDGPIRLAPLICFEDSLPDYARAFVRLHPDADVLVNITNDGWFRTSPGKEMHFVNALFRTVELDRPLLRCGNNGVTVAVEQTGRIAAPYAGPSRGVLAGELRWRPAGPTPYARYGDWIVAVSAAVVALSLAARRRN